MADWRCSLTSRKEGVTPISRIYFLFLISYLLFPCPEKCIASFGVAESLLSQLTLKHPRNPILQMGILRSTEYSIQRAINSQARPGRADTTPSHILSENGVRQRSINHRTPRAQKRRWLARCRIRCGGTDVQIPLRGQVVRRHHRDAAVRQGETRL